MKFTMSLSFKRKRLLSLILLFAFSATPIWGQEKNRQFRSEPLLMLTYQQAESMAVANHFYDATWNVEGKGVKHKYEAKEIEAAKVIFDHGTGLTWQQSGSAAALTIEQAREFVQQLNQNRFAGFRDWRLPTLEEAMTLLQPKKNRQQLHIDPVFDFKQQWIWTADRHGPELIWVVIFDFGGGYEYVYNVSCYVRAVRHFNATSNLNEK